jgi:hypothetical protein
MFDDGMWIIYLEALLALGLLVFIVWWTLPRKKTVSEEPPRLNDQPGQRSQGDGSRSGPGH